MVGRAGGSERRVLLPHGTHQVPRRAPAPSHSPSVPGTHRSLSAMMPPTLGAQHMEMGRASLPLTGDRAPQPRDGPCANGTMNMWASPLKGQDARLLPALAASPGVVFPNATHALVPFEPRTACQSHISCSGPWVLQLFPAFPLHITNNFTSGARWPHPTSLWLLWEPQAVTQQNQGHAQRKCLKSSKYGSC